MTFLSAWQQGADAARAGKPTSANPYSPLSYDFVTWMHGWTFATHRMAIEDDDL